MDGFGAITDTHNLEDSVVTALERLEDMPDVPKKIKLVERAHNYRDILASWELMPPSAEEQSETVSAVLQLLGRVMAYVNSDIDDPPSSQPSQPPPPSSEPPSRGSEPPSPRVRPKAFPSSRRSAFSTTGSDPPSSPPTPSNPEIKTKKARRPLPRRQQASKRKVSVGRIELELALKNDQIATADILFPFQRPWKELARVEGGAVKILQEDPIGGSHVLVRLAGKAELGVHVQAAPELIYVLRGGIRLGEESLFAGAVIRTSANAACPSLRSIGESELLFIGTVRPELAG